MIIRGNAGFVVTAAGTMTMSLKQDLAIRSGYVWEFNAGRAYLELSGPKSVVRSGAVSLRNRQPTAGSLDGSPACYSVSDVQSVCAAVFGMEYGVSGGASHSSMMGQKDFLALYDKPILVEDFSITLALLAEGTTTGRFAWMLDLSEVKRDVSRLDIIQRSLS